MSMFDKILDDFGRLLMSGKKVVKVTIKYLRNIKINIKTQNYCVSDVQFEKVSIFFPEFVEHCIAIDIINSSA